MPLVIYNIIRNTFGPQHCGVEECGALIKNREKFGFTASPRMEVARCMDHVNALIVAPATIRDPERGMNMPGRLSGHAETHRRIQNGHHHTGSHKPTDRAELRKGVIMGFVISAVLNEYTPEICRLRDRATPNKNELPHATEEEEGPCYCIAVANYERES